MNLPIVNQRENGLEFLPTPTPTQKRRQKIDQVRTNDDADDDDGGEDLDDFSGSDPPPLTTRKTTEASQLNVDETTPNVADVTTTNQVPTEALTDLPESETTQVVAAIGESSTGLVDVITAGDTTTTIETTLPINDAPTTSDPATTVTELTTTTTASTSTTTTAAETTTKPAASESSESITDLTTSGATSLEVTTKEAERVVVEAGSETTTLDAGKAAPTTATENVVVVVTSTSKEIVETSTSVTVNVEVSSETTPESRVEDTTSLNTPAEASPSGGINVETTTVEADANTTDSAQAQRSPKSQDIESRKVDLGIFGSFWLQKPVQVGDAAETERPSPVFKLEDYTDRYPV